MAITMVFPTSLRTARGTALLAAALMTLAVLGCKSQGRADADEDEDERPAAAPESAANRPSAGATNSERGSLAPGAVAAPNAPRLARSAITWNVDAGAAGSAPTGFSFGRTGSGRAGRWLLRTVPDAPSGPNVLAQEDNDRTDYRFPVAVEDSASFGDVSLSVHCKPVSGRVDQACGIVWRYRDENSYYLARANALEDNVNFYYVENGRRREVKGWRGTVASGVWHQLQADVRGDHVEVYFDGAKVLDAHDSRFAAPGKAGVWTKADSHTLFDDLTAWPPGSYSPLGS